MEALCIASIVANFVGWIAYTAYAPPIYYNVFMWGLAYVQWARLFIMGDDDANYHGLHMVRRNLASHAAVLRRENFMSEQEKRKGRA